MVNVDKPRERRLVVTLEAVVKVHENVVIGDVAIQRRFRVSQQLAVVEEFVGRQFARAEDDDLAAR